MRLVRRIKSQVSNIMAGKPRDIVAAIKYDHEALRDFLKILKDTDRNMTERRRAYVSFESLLKSHTIAEEKALYKAAEKLKGKDLQIKVAEGYVEHDATDHLMARIKRMKDSTDWSAHANVIAEILEHHLDEEESDLLPLVRKRIPTSMDEKTLDHYLKLRKSTQKSVGPKNQGVLKYTE